MDLGKKVARNEFPHAGPKYVDLFATATQRPRKAFHVCKGMFAPPPTLCQALFSGAGLFAILLSAAEMGVEVLGGGLAGGGGGGAEVAVDEAGAVAGVEETALRGLGAHAHDGDGAGGA